MKGWGGYHWGGGGVVALDPRAYIYIYMHADNSFIIDNTKPLSHLHRFGCAAFPAPSIRSGVCSRLWV